MKDDEIDRQAFNQNKDQVASGLRSRLCNLLDTDCHIYGSKIASFDVNINKFIELCREKQIEVLKQMTPEERAVFEEEFRLRKEKKKTEKIMTYFGQRLNEKDLKISKNMYETIR